MKALSAKKRLQVVAALGVIFALSVPAPVAPAPAPTYASNTLHDLGSVEQFRDAFNADKERPRLVLLLSPT